MQLGLRTFLETDVGALDNQRAANARGYDPVYQIGARCQHEQIGIGRNELVTRDHLVWETTALAVQLVVGRARTEKGLARQTIGVIEATLAIGHADNDRAHAAEPSRDAGTDGTESLDEHSATANVIGKYSACAPCDAERRHVATIAVQLTYARLIGALAGCLAHYVQLRDVEASIERRKRSVGGAHIFSEHGAVAKFARTALGEHFEPAGETRVRRRTSQSRLRAADGGAVGCELQRHPSRKICDHGPGNRRIDS